MNASTTTKIINAVESYQGPESLGFVRYMHLPQRISKAMGFAHVIAKNPINTFIPTVVEFFGGMTSEEYKAWLLAN